jgi:murein DD-endopeptidase MepM/ murein hydrolase activator NlpD
MRYLIILLLFQCPGINAQTLKFLSPLHGTNGKEFYLIYPDNDPSKGTLDAYCGNNSYHGHSGTDFLLRSFRQMDSGVVVHAIADGQVIARKDGLYDRNKNWNTKGWGNYVEILHGDYNVHYAHLMAGSLLVKKGEFVREGQPIAKVGSSGMSSNPHLHLEINDGYGFVDPFGKCGEQRETMWKTEMSYDTAVYAIDAGFIPYRPGLDSLKEGIGARDTFDTKTDTVVCFWALMHGLQKGQEIHAAWYEPGRERYHSYKYTWSENLWYDHFWNYKQMPMLKGKWEVELFVDGKYMISKEFYVR